MSVLLMAKCYRAARTGGQIAFAGVSNRVLRVAVVGLTRPRAMARKINTLRYLSMQDQSKWRRPSQPDPFPALADPSAVTAHPGRGLR